MNVRFIRRVRGALRGFLNFLKSLFKMLKGPLLLLFFSDLMYVIISLSEVKSNLNDCSIGFVRKSSYVFCVGIPFSICFRILQKKWLNVFAILFAFFCYQLSIVVYVPSLLGVFLIDVDNLFDTCPNFIWFILVFKKGFVVICFTSVPPSLARYFIKRIPIELV